MLGGVCYCGNRRYVVPEENDRPRFPRVHQNQILYPWQQHSFAYEFTQRRGFELVWGFRCSVVWWFDGLGFSINFLP